MVTNPQGITYFLNLFSIKHYPMQLMAEFGASIANIKRLCVSYKLLDTLEVRANLTAF